MEERLPVNQNVAARKPEEKPSNLRVRARPLPPVQQAAAFRLMVRAAFLELGSRD
jgi:hypothetical protein